jgi:hypothetical protein
MRAKKAKQLESEIETLYCQLVRTEDEMATRPGYSPSIASLCSRLMTRQAQLNDIVTRRIIWLTWVLLVSTIALFVVEVRAVFFPKDSSAHIETKQAGQNHEVVVPTVTNR